MVNNIISSNIMSMQHSIFNCLSSLPGISDKVIVNLKRLLPNTKIIDLLLHRPINLIERRKVDKLIEIRPGDIITIPVQVIQHQPSQRKHSPYKVIGEAVDGQLTLVFFHANKHYLSKLLPLNSKKIISGKMEKLYTITHPDYIADSYADIRNIEPVYPLTRGITNRMLINFITKALNYLPDLPEWIEQETLDRNNWLSWKETIINLHNPKNRYDLVHHAERLAYDEFFAYQLQLQMTRYNKQQQKGQAMQGDGLLRKYLLDKLPFQLTTGQKQVISEILQDQSKSQKMIRLLQGDVGSGKTVVALFAILNVVECGMQAAFMAPTETLAIQHAEWIQSLVGDKIRVELLTGKSKDKKQISKELASATIKILIGTHALFQDKVTFNNLALVIVDEQHRFGVKQRAKLYNKGDNVDLLLMSATPIPRTLNLTLYGDIDCSILSEKPQNRLPVITSIIKKDNLEKVIDSVSNAINNEAKVYWVCPLIKESEKIDMMAAMERFDHLSSIFREKVGLAHGQMKQQERHDIILKFKSGEIKILVATTVIEVGLDITDANIMVIENAERFGLSQLHQLRGRVGRGNQQSYCILLYNNASKITYQRLKIIKESNNGFYIAEQDLKFRGGGEMVGYKQSGSPNFRFINLQEESTIPMTDILYKAQQIINCDPTLEGKKELCSLLTMFNYTKMIYQ